ncbi:MAG: site-specific DNA-methyltransferase [Patescibacteria group bacterium]|nr:site-specific DNA-methyltransferase [Patescibacteria group bacterium]MDD4304021.1 site-specific DNA-methyltransferase [Patescibacteria group bacterium]MDD4694898.1 site-specific DNA-methyltransferase [Patescibacteria group bacterium]
MKKLQLQSADKLSAKNVHIEDFESKQQKLFLKEIENLKNEIKKLKSRKKYGLVWEDKPEQVVDMCKDKLPVLVEEKNKEIKADKNKPIDILIEGDNYHSLSVLNYTHKGKIDVIYIDPPYNTGNKDFIYNDRYVDKEDNYRHSKWLSFMNNRLRLVKNLLKEDGLIFISIDDNEASQLKLLCDDIFGEQNLLDIFYLQVRYAGKSLNEKDDFQKLIEQVLIYAKNKHKFKPNKPSDIYSLAKFKFRVVEKTRGKKIKLGNKEVEIFKKGEYEIIEEKEENINLLKATWASGSVLKGNTSGKFFHTYLENRRDIDGLGTLYKVYGIGEDGIGYRYFTGPKKSTATKGIFYTGIPNFRRTDIEGGIDSHKERPIVNFYDYSGDFGNIRHEGAVDFRSGKKPTKMLKELINLNGNKKSVVLDFFAGSGSTGHAVEILNKEDGGERQFILCTSNEGDVCTKVCYPRIKNVSKDFNNNVKYFKTDFVDAKQTDRNKKKLIDKSTEMLCLKESCFKLVKKGESFKIFTNNKNKYLGIVYDDTGIESFKKEVNKLNKSIITYIFSLDDSAREEEFENIKRLVELKPIPVVILNVYKRIFK